MSNLQLNLWDNMPETIRLKPVRFTASKICFSDIWAQFSIDQERAKIQFFKKNGGSFDGLDIAGEKALKAFSADQFIFEEMPEFDSWYLELKNLPLGISGSVVETVLYQIRNYLERSV